MKNDKEWKLAKKQLAVSTRRKRRKQAKKYRIKEHKKKLEIKVSPKTIVPKLPEEIVIEAMVKNGLTKKIMNVVLFGHPYSITVKKVEETSFGYEVSYSVNGKKQESITLEGFNKVIRLNRKRNATILANAI